MNPYDTTKPKTESSINGSRNSTQIISKATGRIFLFFCLRWQFYTCKKQMDRQILLLVLHKGNMTGCKGQ